jgi:hypothetical protein
LQERSNSVVSRERNFQSIPNDYDNEEINNENKTPTRRHQRSAPYPNTNRGSGQKNELAKNNQKV